ncbi:hypothetical protein BCR33DRAFT_845516 [Rhizoclosmatium globosum]|uniref:Hexosyltransferase n=1 Tax=Rhizoclosmatium globosum TaxID=329046 RepID=A0A1Y2CZ46_9FUNG|nr:hypothetical protein BCR33DRAFT_845516 [Rhizoclosmatium globosum]|eukprot:ORY52322.1 hypothetical protein BCR33DRAFT_845516 [Rhizoclosmatium globosum]
MSDQKALDIRFILLALGALALILVSSIATGSLQNQPRYIHHLNHFSSAGGIKAPTNATVSVNAETGKLAMQEFSEDCPPPKAALIGVMTTTSDASSNRRNLLREIYRNANPSPTDAEQIDFVYVFGNGKSWEAEYQLTMEEIAHPSDTIITEREENMNDGKTYDWFNLSRGMLYTEHPVRKNEFCLRYRFVGKTDDDAIIHVPRLSKLLLQLPISESHFVGRALDFYMTGMLYLLSADIVEWIHTSPIPAKNAVGHEDMQTGVWLQKGLPKADIKHHDQKELFHDLEESHNVPRHRSHDKSIVIHWCKDIARFFRCYGDLYGTPPSALKRLTTLNSLKLHQKRLKGKLPSLVEGGLDKELKLTTDFNIATQLDAVMMKPLVEKIIPTLVKDEVTKLDLDMILRHMAARVDWLKENELTHAVLRAIAAMESQASDSHWETAVAHKLKSAIDETKGPLTWAQVKKIRS